MNGHTEKHDVYERITNQIIAAIENGADKYRMPWHRNSADTFAPVNAASKSFYRGINILSLWAAAEKNKYPTGYWATYRQWQDLGAQVKHGEKAALVVFWKFRDQEQEEAPEGEESKSKTSRAILARGYSVFNAAQVDGYTAEAPKDTDINERISSADAFFTNLNADIRHGGNRAYYSPAGDYIQMPCFGSFIDSASYFSVLGHECCHWSGSSTRLNRDLKPRFNEEAYAAEELIAELGAAFLCADLGISNEPRPDHASYLNSWLTVLRHDRRAIFTASSKAQQAVDWLHSQQKEIKAAA